jgi:hypothetical protein
VDTKFEKTNNCFVSLIDSAYICPSLYEAAANPGGEINQGIVQVQTQTA